MPLDWNTFSAFGDTLDGSILNSHDEQLQDKIDKCYEWLQSVRDEPLKHDIPADRIGDVQKVFQAMFESNQLVSDNHIPQSRAIFDCVDKPIKLQVLARNQLPYDAGVVANQLNLDNRTKDRLRELATTVIRERYAPNYSQQNTQHLANCKELLLFFVQPHVFKTVTSQVQTQAQTTQAQVQTQEVEVVLIPVEDSALMDFFTPLWNSCHDALLNKLDYLKDRQEN